MRKYPGALSVIVTIAIFACNHHASPSGSASSLEKTHWKLTGLSSLPNGLPSLGKDVTLSLDTGRAVGFAGCNRYFGGYTHNGSTLKFNGVASTKMFCQGAMEAENGLMQAFNNTESYHITGHRLALLKGNDTLARFEATRHVAK